MQVLSKLSSLFFVFFIFCLITGCHLFESTKVSSQEIETASKWSSKDIGPTFDACDSVEREDLSNCFKEIISSTLLEYFSSSISSADKSIEEEIVLVIKIDKEGDFSFGEIDFSNDLIDAIPDIESIFSDAIYQLPEAKPAIKSNVGAFVSTEFKLPIKITAQEPQ
tara:strand:+ start:1264 stop:1761 length:498 start_codon:yes stop_codon:yes gene_type:complete